MIEISRKNVFKVSDLKELFSSVGWISSKYPAVLVRAFKESSHVVSAWEDKKLVGIIRSMDDGIWSANIDCLVVHKDFQKKGIAKLLMKELLIDIKDIFWITVCPDDKSLESFYGKFDFEKTGGIYMQKRNSCIV